MDSFEKSGTEEEEVSGNSDENKKEGGHSQEEDECYYAFNETFERIDSLQHLKIFHCKQKDDGSIRNIIRGAKADMRVDYENYVNQLIDL